MIAGSKGETDLSMENLDEGKMIRAMGELERDMGHMDENNPKHMAYLMRKMQQILPLDSLPKEMDTAIKRLEAGEDPEKIEEDMGDLFSDLMDQTIAGAADSPSGFSRDPGLYDL